MTREEQLDWLYRLKSNIPVYLPAEWGIPMGNALDMAIKALEQQPCEDCISRQAVIEHICESKECYKEECKGRTLKRCPDLQWVFDLPSVTPKYTDEEIDKAQAVEQAYVDKMVELAVEETKRPKGKWINDNCSICGYGVRPWNNTPYCPNCGADMSGGEEDADSD